MTEIRVLYGTTLIDLHGWLLQQAARLAERFEGPSALAEFSVRGLAGHITTLVEVARLRHGDAAVVRALSRRERDTAEALRVI